VPTIPEIVTVESFPATAAAISITFSIATDKTRPTASDNPPARRCRSNRDAGTSTYRAPFRLVRPPRNIPPLSAVHVERPNVAPRHRQRPAGIVGGNGQPDVAAVRESVRVPLVRDVDVCCTEKARQHRGENNGGGWCAYWFAWSLEHGACNLTGCCTSACPAGRGTRSRTTGLRASRQTAMSKTVHVISL
jgi:hypothetical protein